jgi:hypothetical protein
MDVRTDPEGTGTTGHTTVGSHASPGNGRWRLMEDQRVARPQDQGILLAVPARVRGPKGSGDTVTVEFTFEPEEDYAAEERDDR